MIQADSFNLSRIQTAIVAAITTNVELADAPGNVLLPARSAGLLRDSVVNVSQLLTLDRSFLTEHAGALSPRLLRSVDEGRRHRGDQPVQAVVGIQLRRIVAKAETRPSPRDRAQVRCGPRLSKRTRISWQTAKCVALRRW